MMEIDKQTVHDFWDAASCGERLYLEQADREHFQHQAQIRYDLEPFIQPFARFDEAANQDVLEIGVGLGADHQGLAAAGARLHGIDLTERAIAHTRRRLELFGLYSELRVGDAENLPYPDEAFDIVYSWGVLHHSPDTRKAIAEVWRVLKPGGTARIMVYHKWSLVGLMLWMRYALLRFRPFTPLAEIYARYLESPGTKAYSVAEARRMFGQFGRVSIETVLTHGDLLSSQAGQRHQGLWLNVARRVWPRWLIRKVAPNSGLFMLIRAVK